ncbi:MAG TPA: hypothetical protein VFK11_03510 [Candidatus Saccharimonadales bacterium]|nr:hypothetical protein [Candidatus Saccharimonadales bacterium]
MNMRGYINAWCDIERRNPGAWERHWGGGDYEDDYYYPESAPVQHLTEPATPSWLTEGLQQYLELVDEEGKIEPRAVGEDFSHLTASARPSKVPSFFEVSSDALYIPEGADVGRTALGGNVFLLNASFSLGAKNRKTPRIKPRFTLDVVEIGGEGRENVIRAHEENEGVQLFTEDLVDEAGKVRSLARVKSAITTPKTSPQISKPVAREQKDGKWNTPMYPGNVANGLLKVSLSPVLNDQIQRIPIEPPVPTLPARV